MTKKKLSKDAIYAICQQAQNKYKISDAKKERCVIRLKLKNGYKVEKKLLKKLKK